MQEDTRLAPLSANSEQADAAAATAAASQKEDGPSLAQLSLVHEPATQALKTEQKTKTGLLSLPDDLLQQIMELVFADYSRFGGIVPPFKHLREHYRPAEICRRLYPMVKAALTRCLSLAVHLENVAEDYNVKRQRHFLRSPFMRPPTCRGYVRWLSLTYKNKTGDETIKAAASEALLLINQFPALTKLKLVINGLSAAEVNLFLHEFVLPKESSFKIDFRIDMCWSPSETEVLALDNLPKHKSIYHLLQNVDIDAGLGSFRDPSLNIQLFGKAFAWFAVFGVSLVKTHGSAALQMKTLYLHVFFLIPSAARRAVDRDILEKCHHLTTLRLDLQAMFPSHWRKVAKLIPGSVRDLHLEGRELPAWNWKYIGEELELADEEEPTILSISMLRYISHLPLTMLRTDWIFFTASSSSFDRRLIPSTLESLVFTEVGQFPLHRFTDWLEIDRSAELCDISLEFLDPTVFSLAALTRFAAVCREHQPKSISLEMTSDLELRAQGSEYATTSEEGSDG